MLVPVHIFRVFVHVAHQFIESNSFFHSLRPEKNLIEAASSGASASIQLVANVAVNVMAFLSILAFVNATLNWFGERAGIAGVSFQVR